MKSLFIALASLALFTASAAAERLPPLAFSDLNGATHTLPRDWQGRSSVLILGFTHNARDTMDQWVSALGLHSTDTWLESPVVGNVNEMIRPMIRTGMRGRYDETRRAHVAPVFDHADAVRRLATPRNGDVVVFVLDTEGNIVERADGPPSESNAARLRAALQN